MTKPPYSTKSIKNCLQRKLMNQELSFVATLSQIIKIYILQAEKMRNNATKPTQAVQTQRESKQIQDSENSGRTNVGNKPILEIAKRDKNTSSSRNCRPQRNKRQRQFTEDDQEERIRQQQKGIEWTINCTKYNYDFTFNSQKKQLQINANHTDLKNSYQYRLDSLNYEKFYEVIHKSINSRFKDNADFDPWILMSRLQKLDLQGQQIFFIDPTEYYLQIGEDSDFRIPISKRQQKKDKKLRPADIRALFGLQLLEKIKQSNPETFLFLKQQNNEESILSKLPPHSSRQRQNLANEYRKLFSIQKNPIFAEPQSEDFFDSFSIGARLKNGKLKGAFIYNITQITIKVTNEVNSENEYNLIITGKGGAGKSMALIYYPTIFNKFIQPLLFLNDLSAVSQYKKPEFFRRLRKVFYISITQKLNEDYVFQCLNRQISKHYRLNKSQVNFENYAFLQQIVKVYQSNQRKWKFVLIVDQINVYTSLLRRLEEQGNHDACKNISQFLYAIYGKFRIIYCSSNNLERSFGQYCSSTKPQNNYFQLFDKRRGLVGQLQMTYEQNPLPPHRILGRLSTLAFQIRQRLHDKVDLENQKHQVIKKINALKQKVLSGNKLKSLANICCSITHKSMNIYFQQKFQEAKTFIIKHFNDQNFIEELMIRIRNYQILCESDQFGAFFGKGNKQIKENKLYFLELLETHAKLALEKSESDSCCFQASGTELIKLIRENYFQEIFNRNIAYYDSYKKKVTIFYSPSEFLRLTRKVKGQTDLARDIYFSVFEKISKDPSQYGKRVDHCFTTIFSTVKLHLKIQISKRKTFIIDTQGVQSVFQHFASKEIKYNIMHKFENLLQKAQVADNKYYGAYPILKNRQNLDVYDERLYSYSSPTVDSLFLRKIGQSSYQVLTFDFTVATKIDQFTIKYNNAIGFFDAMKAKSDPKQDFDKFRFIHFIAILDEFLEKSHDVKSLAKKPASVQIFFVSLDKFRLEFNENDLDSFTRHEYHFILEKFGKSSQKESARNAKASRKRS